MVTAAGNNGLSNVVDSLLPHGQSLPALLGVAVVSAVLANLVNNLPATLIIVAVCRQRARRRAGHADRGQRRPQPHLRRLAGDRCGGASCAHDEDIDIAEFLKLGALTVPVTLIAATAGLWLALQVF